MEIVNRHDPYQNNGTKLLYCHQSFKSVQNFELIRPFRVGKNIVQRFRYIQTEEVKACQLVASLREAAEVLQTLTDRELLNLNSLYNALDLRFGQKFSKDYAHLQMKTRHQKPEECLQEYAFEM
ncbi:uncharacterized protein TNCV_4547781 [Trichonephila clavipes]|nr:uncharacterized protein TNCV_4547781 [Trichonephila clavipes]